MFNARGRERAGVCGRRQLRRLSSADARGVRRRRAAAARAADVGELGQRRPAAAADGLLLSRGRAGTGRLAQAGASRRLHAERQLRQPDRRLCREARRAADRAASSPRPTSTTSCPQYLETGRFEPRPVRADDRERDGRRPPEQLRAHALALSTTTSTPCGTICRQPLSPTTRCARRSGASTTSAAICSIRTARLPTWDLKAAWRQERQAGRGRNLSGDGASGEVPRDRRADHRPRHRDAGAAGRGAGAPAARPAHRGVAGGSCRGPSWLTIRSGQVHSTDRADVLAALPGHGILHSPDTTLSLVRDYVRDLYKWEIPPSSRAVSSSRFRSGGPAAASINSGARILCWRPATAIRGGGVVRSTR